MNDYVVKNENTKRTSGLIVRGPAAIISVVFSVILL